MKIPEEYAIYIITGAMLIFASAVNATGKWQKAKKNKESDFSWSDYFILVFISVFSGMFFGIFASIYFSDIRVILLISSIGSFLGIDGVNKAASIFLDLGESWLRNMLNSKKND